MKSIENIKKNIEKIRYFIFGPKKTGNIIYDNIIKCQYKRRKELKAKFNLTEQEFRELMRIPSIFSKMEKTKNCHEYNII